MFRFAYPEYLWLLWLLPLLVAVWTAAGQLARRRLSRFGRLETIRPLMPDASTGRRRLKFILYLTAFALLTLALARPQLGSKLREVESRGIEMMLVVDVSNSMLAEDFQPNRLERTKYAIDKLFDGLKQDRVGLVVFAGDAVVQLPITSDYRMAKAFARRISPSMVSVQGTDIGQALSLATMSFSEKGDNPAGRVIVLITDGEGHDSGAIEAAERAAEQGIRIFTIGIGTPEGAPIQIGGEFIKIAPGSPHCINIMEIRHTISPEMELIDEIDYVEMGSMLARKIQQLMTFFGLLIPDMSNEEEQMLDEALIRTYADFGITHDNDSIYTDMSSAPPKMKQMPILGDLHKHLQENPMTQRLAAIISRFVTGSAQSFNRQTNVDLSNKYIVLDLSELKGKLLPVGMFIALDYVWDQIKSDRTKRKAIFIDEIWQLIGASSNRMAAEFCLEIFKVIRGFGGAAISATQDLSDFFGLEDGKYGRAIINNSKNKIILNLEPDEARYVQETLKLTRTEIRAITRFERGEALISSNNNKVPVVVKASKLEKEMITTDRAELEAILKERQREKTHSA